MKVFTIVLLLLSSTAIMAKDCTKSQKDRSSYRRGFNDGIDDDARRGRSSCYRQGYRDGQDELRTRNSDIDGDDVAVIAGAAIVGSLISESIESSEEGQNSNDDSDRN